LPYLLNGRARLSKRRQEAMFKKIVGKSRNAGFYRLQGSATAFRSRVMNFQAEPLWHKAYFKIPNSVLIQ